MHDSKNLWLTIFLSALVMLAWQYFYAIPQHKVPVVNAVTGKTQGLADPAAERSPGGAGKAMLKERDAAITESPRVLIDNGELHGSINLKGARFDDIELTKYKQTIEQGSPPVVLLSPADTESFYFGEFGWLAKGNGQAPDSSAIWKADSNKLTPGKPLTLTWRNNSGVVFKQVITLDENYMFKVTQSVENKSAAPLELKPYGLLNRTHKKAKTYYILHEGPLGVINGTLQEITYQKLIDDKKIEYKDAKGWLGVTDKYWLTAIVPEGDNFDSHFIYSGKDNIDRFQVDYLGKPLAINPGETKETSAYFFAGAKEVRLLDDYAKKLNITLFDRAIDFGWLYFLTKQLFYLLNFIHTHVGNFGVAIILLTLIVKLLLFPIANKSYKSMSKMKTLQPEIMKLRERFKDDKVKLNQGVMELYKREKVNPLSGCLPLLIQIPIFLALYKVFFVTIEMRQAPFFGWIHDLSAPDPTSIFNLFGLLHWNPPAFLMIGILPLLYGITMFIQQSLNPAPADPVQAQMMKALPFLLVFMFASFPAGLVLYWVCSNILSIAQQWVITRETRREKK